MRATAAISLCTAVLALGPAGCGGGEEPPVELSIEGDASRSTAMPTVVLTGRSYVPSGSTCPASSEFVIIGSLGPHTITYRNESTGVEGPVFDQIWVCNGGDGRTMSWVSNPISLQPGANQIRVSMQDSRRSSSAAVTVTRQ